MHSTEAVVAGVVGLATATVPAFGGIVAAVAGDEGLDVPTAIIIGTVLTGITVPLVKWVLGKLDKSLDAQKAFNKQQAANNEAMTKMLGVLISEQREKRRENALHHEEMMQRMDVLEEALEASNEVSREQRVQPEVPEKPA